MASTNWDTDRKRRRPPTWDPPKLLPVIISGLHVVEGTSIVAGIIVDDDYYTGGAYYYVQAADDAQE